MSRYVAPGRGSSEYFKSLRAEVAGFALLLIALAFCLLGVVLTRPLACWSGIGLSLPAAFLVAHAQAAYAAARGNVKHAAHLPHSSKGI